MSCQQIIKFLNRYQINYIDSNTTIITESQNNTNSNKYINPDESSLTNFLMSNSRRCKYRKNAGNATAGNLPGAMPLCYLVKDMIIDDGAHGGSTGEENQEDGQGMLRAALETLSMHQQLSNKYILTLLHYQLFNKYPHSDKTHQESIQNQTKKQNMGYQQKNSHIMKNLLTKTEQSTYRQMDNHQQLQQDKFQIQYSHLTQKNPQNYPEATTSHHHTNSKHTNISMASMNNSLSNSNEPQTAIRAIYEYGKITLKQQIKNRIASSTQFEEEELWAIFATLVQALGYLEEEGIVYGVLGTDKIFINNSLVKLLDPSATATDPLLIAEGRLYSPQILNDQQNINMFKSDVYITGLVLLECALLVDLSKQPQPNLDKYLQVFRTVYSKQLVDIVALCLAIDPKQRPSFQQLKQYLSKQLDMNDFQSAYDNKGTKLLNPMNYDTEDNNNPGVNQIQCEGEGEEASYDILYESLGDDEIVKISGKRKTMNDYERAMVRYLGVNVYQKVVNDRQVSSQINKCDNQQSQQSQQNNQQSLSQCDMQKNKSYKQKHKRIQSHSTHHRHTSPSFIETRRNSKVTNNMFNNNMQNMQNMQNVQNPQGNGNYYNGNHYNNGGNMPRLNVAISESIYPEQVPVVFKNNQNVTQKTNRKGYKLNQNLKNYNHAINTNNSNPSQQNMPNRYNSPSYKPANNSSNTVKNQARKPPPSQKPKYVQSQFEIQSMSQKQNVIEPPLHLQKTIGHNMDSQNDKEKERLKKTKLIKDKLVRNQEPADGHARNYNSNNEDGKEGPAKNSQKAGKYPPMNPTKQSSRANHQQHPVTSNYNKLPQSRSNQVYHQNASKHTNMYANSGNNLKNYKEYSHNHNMLNNRYNNQSIREELEEESENSCLYYNQNSISNSNENSMIESKKSLSKSKSNDIKSSNVNSNGVANSRNSQNSTNANIKMSKASQRYEPNNPNTNIARQSASNLVQVQSQNSKSHRTLLQKQQQQIFTDPNFLQTIKDDLARISNTAKNIQLNHVMNNNGNGNIGSNSNANTLTNSNSNGNFNANSKDRWFK